VHVSPGCQHCYAETIARRFRRGGPFNVPTTSGVTPFLFGPELEQMLTYKPATGKRCFVGDMTDVFGEWVPDELLDRLFAVFFMRSDVTWQVLTKRSDRARAYLASSDTFERIAEAAMAYQFGGFDVESEFDARDAHDQMSGFWPLPNVWLGVSAEDQERANQRLPDLLATPAAVRFVSAEPLLGPITLLDHLYKNLQPTGKFRTAGGVRQMQFSHDGRSGLHWVIAGGESGPGARPCNVEWVRSLLAQCEQAGVPCFVKQLGSDNRSALGFGPLDGVRGKGADPSKWPEDLRVREYPSHTVPA